MKLRQQFVVAVLALGVVVSSPVARAEPVAAEIAGTSPDGLGNWAIEYQHVVVGGPVAAAINDGIDAEAQRQVQQQTWGASTKRPWTFSATGTVSTGAITVAELFVGQYNTAEPTMPIQTVATAVFDSRSGVPITWDNLFRDTNAGLTRLAEQSAVILPTVYTEPHPGLWNHSGALAPLDINFKYWIPAALGIELHFPDYQFGRGLKVITVPWAAVADLIAPEFAPIMA